MGVFNPTPPANPDTAVQFNQTGDFAGSANFIFDGNYVKIGDIADASNFPLTTISNVAGDQSNVSAFGGAGVGYSGYFTAAAVNAGTSYGAARITFGLVKTDWSAANKLIGEVGVDGFVDGANVLTIPRLYASNILLTTIPLYIDLTTDLSHINGIVLTKSVTLNEAPANQQYSGITQLFTYGEALTPGTPVYYKSDGKVYKADANGASTYPVIGLALETFAAGSHLVLLSGLYRDDALFNWTVGGTAGTIYLSTTAGALTQTQPSATDDVIQVVGWAVTADSMYVNPSPDYITHT